MTGAEALRDAVRQLVEIDGAARDARVLLACAMGVPADRLVLHLGDEVTPKAMGRFAGFVAARLLRQPVSQIVGRRLFWGQWFAVTRDVLDPRPETEVLVAAALERRFARVLDLGTGSGCILLSCLAGMPGAVGMGVDISEAALAVARGNAEALGLVDRCQFQVADWWQGVEDRFDLILSNPPYIAASEMAGLAPEVRGWEPHLALTPGEDGLAAYRVIIAGVWDHLEPNGRLMVEIGPTQGKAVGAMMAAVGLVGARILPDLDGRDRVVMAQMP